MGNNPLAPFFKGEFMIRQQYQECPAYRVNSFLEAICKNSDSFLKFAEDANLNFAICVMGDGMGGITQ
jgi:hypothetical protein